MDTCDEHNKQLFMTQLDRKDKVWGKRYERAAPSERREMRLDKLQCKRRKEREQKRRERQRESHRQVKATREERRAAREQRQFMNWMEEEIEEIDRQYERRFNQASPAERQKMEEQDEEECREMDKLVCKDTNRLTRIEKC